ncbi:KxYKxGKxW signal peptide domain-containing protein [Levilactobacillus senmaizukei]|nr:KxYKxGKxW signal peptide domain-containing protein [Levilactobacillus senmaizukei]
MRMQKRGNIPTTTKLHFKLYKAGKLWLVAGLTSIAIIAGLGFTTAQAATDDSASQNPSGQVAGTAQGADDSDNGLNNSTGSEDKPSDNPTSDPNKSTANDQSGQLINSESSLSQIHGSTYDGSAQGLIGAAPASKSTTSQIAAYDASLPTTFDLPDDTTTLTAKTGADSDGNVVTGTALSTLPVLSNFYVNVTGGGYIPYDAKAMVGLVPYDAENFTTFPQDVFGFYVILPETITAKPVGRSDQRCQLCHRLTSQHQSKYRPALCGYQELNRLSFERHQRRPPSLLFQTQRRGNLYRQATGCRWLRWANSHVHPGFHG